MGNTSLTHWEQDCLRWRGTILTGTARHWCPDWDDLPIDETCREYECCTCGLDLKKRNTPPPDRAGKEGDEMRHTVEGPMNRKRTKGDMSSWCRIVDTDGSTVGYTPDHVTAQTHAAAPELLEALSQVITEWDASSGNTVTAMTVDEARAAITKAKGR